jgi:hypothetical protein
MISVAASALTNNECHSKAPMARDLMQKDKRKSRRRAIRYTAWLVLGPAIRHSCFLSDISETGARIDFEEPDAVPDRFLLWLASNGSARRTCRVVWREKQQIGVKFEHRLPDGERAMLRAARGAAPLSA